MKTNQVELLIALAKEIKAEKKIKNQGGINASVCKNPHQTWEFHGKI